ncbi:MAG TPA: amino acid permease, partial [Verrucomicrobiae bacterium]|nr:amino acid permease [Verrucomicrobiae bacterium]
MKVTETPTPDPDAEDLRRLGYAQQLFREMGGFSNFAISFSIISILTGAVLLYGYGLKFAGPIINSVGWPVVSIFTLAVAASMAELASVYPTAGGLYYWAFRLGGRQWAWVTAWLNMIGQVTATAGINVAAAIYIIGAASRMFHLPETLPLTNWYFQLGVMVLITIPQVLINIYGIRLTARINDFSVLWHIGGVAIIAALLIVAGKYHNSFSFLLSKTTVANPWETSTTLVVGNFKTPSPLFSIFPALA